MATFIQGVTDTNLDPVLFTPDYSFLRYNLQKRDAQYEQGLKSVASTYGNLKKELSDPVNMERRDAFMKSADAQLQKIASADLSLQQNVNSANAIFDPIATDPAIVYDQYHTARIKKELSTMESWNASDDMETRKKFNPEIYNWLRRDLDSLKNGNGDVNNYKVQGRKAWAWVDPFDIVNNAAKEMGYKIEHDSLGQPYIITTTGGKTNREFYEAFASNVLDSNPVYNQQRQILGEARVENILDQERQKPENAGLDNTQILSRYVDQAYTSGRDRQNKYLETLDEKLAQQKAEYNAFHASNPNPTGDVLVAMQKKFNDINLFKEQIDKLKSDYNNEYGSDDQGFNERKALFAKSFLENPKGYFANQIRTEDVVRWSNVRSSFGTVSIKPDQGYIAMAQLADKALNTLNTIQNTQHDNLTDDKKLLLKEGELALKAQGKTSTGEKKKNADGTDRLPDIEYQGISSTQVNVTTKIDQLKDELALAKAGAISNMTQTNGGLSLLEKMGSKPEEVGLIRQYFMNSQYGTNVKINAQQASALKNAYSNLLAWVKVNGSPEAAEEIKKLHGTDVSKIDFPDLLKKAVSKYEPKDELEAQAIRNIKDYDKNQAIVKEKSDAVQKGINFVGESIMKSGDSTLKELIRKEKDGNYRFLNTEDVMEWFKDLKTITKVVQKGKLYDDVEQVPVTPELRREIAQAYLDQSLNYKKSGSGSRTQDYFTTKSGDYLISQTAIGDRFWKKWFKIDPNNYSKEMDRLNQKISVPEFEASIPGAAVKGSPIFTLRNEEEERMASFLSSGTQDNSNIFENKSGTATGYSQVEGAQQDEIRKRLADKSNIASVKLYVNSPINSGQQVVEVTFKKKDGEAGAKDPLNGGRYFFPINVNERSNTIFKTFADIQDEFSNYSSKNQPYVMDYHEASGVIAKFYADYPGSKTGTIRIFSKDFDAVNKKFNDNWTEHKAIPFNLNAVSFSELKESVYNDVIYPHVLNRISYNQQQRSQAATVSGSQQNPWNSLKLSW